VTRTGSRGDRDTGNFKEAKAVTDRKKHTNEYNSKKLLLDGAHTELKCPQDALSKSIKVKRTEIEHHLKVRTRDINMEDAVPSSLEEI